MSSSCVRHIIQLTFTFRNGNTQSQHRPRDSVDLGVKLPRGSCSSGPTSPPSVYNSYSKIAQVANAFSTSPNSKSHQIGKTCYSQVCVDTCYGQPNEDEALYQNVPILPPKRPQHAKPAGHKPPIRPDYYDIHGGPKKRSPSATLQSPISNQSPFHTVPTLQENNKFFGNNWQVLRSKTFSKDIPEEFEDGVIVIQNQTTVEHMLNRKPEGTYLIHHGPKHTTNNPFTIYANQVSRKTGRLQTLHTDIHYDSEASTYYAEPKLNNDGNHPSIRALVDRNRWILRYELYER